MSHAFGRALRPAVVAPILIVVGAVLSFWMHDYRLPASDEGAILTQAAKILRGGVYYRDIDAYPYPAATYALAAAMGMFGEHLDVARVLAAFVYTGILLSVYACALALLGPVRAAVIGVALLSFKFLAWPSLTGFFYWDFSFGFASASVAFLLAAQCRDGSLLPRSGRYLLLAGCACGLSFASKQSLGIYLALASAVVICAPTLLSRGEWGREPSPVHNSAVRSLGAFASGMAIVVVPMFVYFAWQGVLPQMIFSGLIRPFVSYLPTSGLPFNAPLRWWEFGAFRGVPGLPYLVLPVWTMIMDASLPRRDWYDVYWTFSELFSRALYTSVVVAFGAALVGAVRATLRGELAADGRRHGFALIAFAVFLSALPRADYPHVISVYPLVLVLLFSLWGGIGAGGRWLRRVIRVAEATTAIALLAGSIALMAQHFSFLTHRLVFARADMRVAPKYAWVASVVRYIEEEVDADESLLVYGHEAYYYFITGRYYDWPFAQLYPGQAGREQGAELAELLIVNPPKVVVRGMIKFSGMPYLPDYAPVLDQTLHALYTRDKRVFERFPPDAGPVPKLRAITVMKRRHVFAKELEAREDEVR